MSVEKFELHLQKTMDNWEDFFKNIVEVKPLSFSGWGDWDEMGVAKD